MHTTKQPNNQSHATTEHLRGDYLALVWYQYDLFAI